MGSANFIKSLVGAVAKEAPELARGATRRPATINIGLDINGGEKLAPEEALAAIQRYGVRPISAKIAQSDTEPTLVVELDRALKPDEANELSAALRQEAIAQVDETGAGDLYGPMADKWKPFNGDYFITHSGERLGSSQVLDGLKQISGEPVEKAGGGLIEDAAKMLLGAAKKGEEKTAQTMRLYHGRAFHKPIQQLDPLISANQLGIHLGDAPTASMFAPIRDNVKPTDAGGRVIPLDVTINNPLRLMDNTGKWNPDDVYKQLVDKGLIQRDSELESRLAWARKGYSVDEEGTLIDDENAPMNAMLEIQDIIRGLGHDGVVYKNRYEFPDEAAQSRAEMRDRSELNSLSDEDFAKEFPEATDSYIAFRRDQLKSPFGDGPGVGYAGGGVVRKLGSGIAELLDFSGVHAGNQIRDDIVRGTELRGDGRKFTNFFGDVTSGASEKYKPHGLDNYDPAITLDEDAARFRALRDGYSGNFDNHIKTSIPGFDETQNAVGSSLLKTYGKNGGDILDIGSSEGALIKALSAASDGRIRTTGIDPNPAMLRTYLEKPQAPGSQSILSAFGSADDAGKLAWEEADGTPIHYFDPGDNKYDAAHEAMVFQFISNARRAQAERMKQLLKPNGLAIFEEKFGNPKAIFDANEAKKDAYKAKYYTPEQMEIKRKEVLNTGNDAVEGMTDLQVSQAEMEKILRDTFKHRAQFWDSGNFKGYAASDDLRALEDYLNNLQSLDSEYATARTPRGFADGGQVSPDQDIADWEFLNNYVASQPEDVQSMTHVGAKPRRPVTLETFGHEFDLGDAPYDVAQSMSTMAQAANDGARMGVYAVPGVGPFIGAGLDTAEAVATGDPTAAVMAAGFGPGGKMAKAALAGTLAYGVDPADAEAGMFGQLSKWGSSKEGQALLNRAKRLHSQGESMDFIRQQNNWFLDRDGVWKFELPSAGTTADLKLLRRGNLGEVYHDPHLFDQHPELETFTVRRARDMKGGAFDPNNDEILIGDISDPAYARDFGGAPGLLAHEVYHKKANMDGWAHGSNTDWGRYHIIEDMKRFLSKKEPGSLTSGDVAGRMMGDYMQKLQGDHQKALASARYNAELGEVLARREQQRMNMNAGEIKSSNPLTTLDTPDDAIFQRNVPATPWQWKSLVDHNNALANAKAANEAAAAAKPKAKGRR